MQQHELRGGWATGRQGLPEEPGRGGRPWSLALGGCSPRPRCPSSEDMGVHCGRARACRRLVSLLKRCQVLGGGQGAQGTWRKPPDSPPSQLCCPLPGGGSRAGQGLRAWGSLSGPARGPPFPRAARTLASSFPPHVCATSALGGCSPFLAMTFQGVKQLGLLGEGPGQKQRSGSQSLARVQLTRSNLGFFVRWCGAGVI